MTRIVIHNHMPKLSRDAGFNESDHPRAANGEFGAGGGSSGGSSSNSTQKPKKEKKELDSGSKASISAAEEFKQNPLTKEQAAAEYHKVQAEIRAHTDKHGYGSVPEELLLKATKANTKMGLAYGTISRVSKTGTWMRAKGEGRWNG